MKKIKEYVDCINEELESAKEYIEKALWYKSTNTMRYNKYKEMAIQELSHAEILHTFAVEDVAILTETFPEPPEAMLEKWNESHKHYVEKTAWVKQMIAM